MPVEELARQNTDKRNPDIWHWYPPDGRKIHGLVSVGDKARCGHIYQGYPSTYPHGAECVVCADLKRT